MNRLMSRHEYSTASLLALLTVVLAMGIGLGALSVPHGRSEETDSHDKAVAEMYVERAAFNFLHPNTESVPMEARRLVSEAWQAYIWDDYATATDLAKRANDVAQAAGCVCP